MNWMDVALTGILVYGGVMVLVALLFLLAVIYIGKRF